MSLFQTLEIPCPACGTDVEYSVVYSVNANRRPDLRAAIIDGTFQRQTCSACQANFRVEPEFNYLDVNRGLWIAAFPLSKLAEWRHWERHAGEVFDKSFGAQASAPARMIGADLTKRIT